jgi:tRNA A37 threonylcarbamoyladenosine modification protein TsaB
MKLLTVDSATEICGAAIVADGRVVGEMSLNRGQTHTRTIMAVVEALLSVSELELAPLSIVLP